MNESHSTVWTSSTHSLHTHPTSCTPSTHSLQTLTSPDTLSSHSVAGLTYLPARVAPWRYQRGCRSSHIYVPRIYIYVYIYINVYTYYTYICTVYIHIPKRCAWSRRGGLTSPLPPSPAGLTYLPARVAPWRYQRGCRSLLDNLQVIGAESFVVFVTCFVSQKQL